MIVQGLNLAFEQGGPVPELSKLAGMGLDGHWKQGRWGP